MVHVHRNTHVSTSSALLKCGQQKANVRFMVVSCTSGTHGERITGGRHLIGQQFSAFGIFCSTMHSVKESGPYHDRNKRTLFQKSIIACL